MELGTTVRAWPNDSAAWFVCRAAGLVDDMMVPLKNGIEADEASIASATRMAAARLFKRANGLHPCTKVDCEFQAVETPEDRATQRATVGDEI